MVSDYKNDNANPHKVFRWPEESSSAGEAVTIHPIYTRFKIYKNLILGILPTLQASFQIAKDVCKSGLAL